jgi:RNA polymerase sigma factor (TIGR02999 family)
MVEETGAGTRRGAEWDSTVPTSVRAIADDLLPVFYGELRRLAHRMRVRVGAGDTLQTTALVHEAYLKLRSTRGWNDESHFLRASALAMRHALINHALARQAGKRGGGSPHVPLDEALDGGVPADHTLLVLDQALERLARHSLRLAQVVECRFFAGLTDHDTARALGISERSVRRDWTLARAWLHRELAGGTLGG